MAGRKDLGPVAEFRSLGEARVDWAGRPAPVRGGLVGAASPTSGCVGGQGSRTCPAPGSVEREQAGDGRSGVAHRGTGFGPVAVTRRCGTQSSTWTKPSNVAPWRTQTSYSERR